MGADRFALLTPVPSVNQDHKHRRRAQACGGIFDKEDPKMIGMVKLHQDCFPGMHVRPHLLRCRVPTVLLRKGTMNTNRPQPSRSAAAGPARVAKQQCRKSHRGLPRKLWGIRAPEGPRPQSFVFNALSLSLSFFCRTACDTVRRLLMGMRACVYY